MTGEENPELLVWKIGAAPRLQAVPLYKLTRSRLSGSPEGRDSKACGPAVADGGRSDAGRSFNPTDGDSVEQALGTLAIQPAGTEVLSGLSAAGDTVGQAHLL